MPAPFTASGAERARACPPSCALPSIDDDTKAAWRGRARHRFLALIADGTPREDALSELSPDEREECAIIDTRSIPVGGETEVAMAFDVRTGKARRLEDAGGRHYRVTETEIPGTADLINWEPRLMVTDWKGCLWGQDPEAVNAQLNLYALMAARVVGVEDAECKVGTVGDDGGLGWRTWTLDWEDLATIAQRTRETHARIQAERVKAQVPGYTPDVRIGVYCRYCPAKLHCPAQRAAVSMMVGQDVPVVTPDNLGEAYGAALAAEYAAEQVRNAARRLIEEIGPVPLPDGRVVTLDSRRHLAVRRAAS